jgi:glycosyltransferase involved in cell wall biosynthesis
MSAPVATVIVCTRNHAELLGDCLRSLVSDGSRTPRELLVVDNGSTDETAAVVASFPGVRHVLEPALGLSNARNRGVVEARGAILLFTDDDVRVEPDWVDNLVAAFEDPRVGAAGGRIVPDWPSAPPAWLDGPHRELLTLIDYGAESRTFAAGEHPLGANMAVRASVARSFDPPFDPALGHRGDARIGWEEVAFMNRVRATHDLAYRADAVVHHLVAPERIDLDWMRTTFVDLGVGLGRHDRNEAQVGVGRRTVRALRTYHGARELKQRNATVERVGPETWDELYAHMWAARHVELLLGSMPRLSRRIARTLV